MVKEVIYGWVEIDDRPLMDRQIDRQIKNFEESF